MTRTRRIGGIAALLIMLACAGHVGAAEEDNSTNLPSLGAGITAVSVALSKADQALVSSIILPVASHIKGDFAEAMARNFLTSYLNPASRSVWLPATARLGRQGLDQVYIRYDRYGNPREVMVVEVKYGSSRLGMTSTGRQMSSRWVNTRLIKMGQRYQDASCTQKCRPMPKGGRPHVVEVKLKDGRVVRFWRENGRTEWYFDGNPSDLSEAQNLAKSTGKIMEASGKGKLNFRKRLIHVEINNNHVLFTISKVRDKGSGEVELYETMQIKLRLNGVTASQVREEIIHQISKEIKRQKPHLDDRQCRRLAEKILKEEPSIEKAFEMAKKYRRAVLLGSIKAGFWSAGFVLADEIYQFFQTGKFNMKLLQQGNVMALATAGTTYLGQKLSQRLLSSATANRVMKSIAIRLGLKTTILRGMLSSTAPAAILCGVASIGAEVFGDDNAKLHSDELAANLAITGLTTASGALASSTIMMVATQLGTASTGTAISSLSGAAATKAALAWLGGGAVSTGGGGVAAGSVILSGGTMLVVLAVGITSNYIWQRWKIHQQYKMSEQNLECLLKDPRYLRAMAEKAFPPLRGS